MYYLLDLEAKEIENNKFDALEDAINEAKRYARGLNKELKVYQIDNENKIPMAIVYPAGSVVYKEEIKMTSASVKEVKAAADTVIKALLERDSKVLAGELGSFVKTLAK